MARTSSQLLYLVLLTLASTVFGQSPTTAGKATNTVNSFPTITDTESTGQLSGNVGSTGSGNKQGASGGSSAFELSGGAIAGIAVACGIIVIGVIVLWALWFYGRKEEMTFRQTINRVGRRVTGRSVPPTPRMMRQMTLPTVNKPDAVYSKSGLSKEEGSETSFQESAFRPKQKVNKYDAFMGRS